jgi:2-(1,2-epoxy-1,2-dihydrophenyl)acetyl-CoA isomerase
MSSALLRSDADGVAVLRLNRPERRNALTTELLGTLRDELRALRDSPEVRAVVLAGEGEAFCAGADLAELAGVTSPRPGLARIRLVSEVVALLRELEQPTVAAVHGGTYGAGWGLALACDLTYAAQGSRFCLPEVPKGLRLPAAIVRRLVEVVGPVRGAELALAGEVHDAAAGLAAGWVARVLPDRAAAVALAHTRAADLARQPRSAIAHVKQVLRRPAAAGLVPPPEYAWNEE